MAFIFLTVVGVSPTSLSLPMFAISFFHPTARAPPTPPRLKVSELKFKIQDQKWQGASKCWDCKPLCSALEFWI